MVLKKVSVELEPASRANQAMVQRKILTLQKYMATPAFSLWDYVGNEPQTLLHGVGGFALAFKPDPHDALVLIIITSKTGVCRIEIELADGWDDNGWREALVEALTVAQSKVEGRLSLVRLKCCRGLKTRITGWLNGFRRLKP